MKIRMYNNISCATSAVLRRKEMRFHREVYGTNNTKFLFIGLAVNRMLQSMTCRRVGLLGAFLFFVGSFATIFVTNLMQMIISFGIIQGDIEYNQYLKTLM